MLVGLNFKNAIALVTGGASGLGKATAEKFIRQGYKGVIIYDLPTSAGKTVASTLGKNCHFVPGDVTKEEDVNNALDFVKKEFNRLDTLVNCAGISIAYKTYNFLKNVPHRLEDFHNCLQVNTLGTFNVIRLAAGLLAQSKPDSNNLIFEKVETTIKENIAVLNNPSLQCSNNITNNTPSNDDLELNGKSLNANIARNFHTTFSNSFDRETGFPDIRSQGLGKYQPKKKGVKPRQLNVFDDQVSRDDSSTHSSIFKDEEDNIENENLEPFFSTSLPVAQDSKKIAVDSKNATMESQQCETIKNTTTTNNNNNLPNSQPRLKENGVIIMTSSSASLDGFGQGGQVAFNASKAAINGMTVPLARDFSQNGIRVVTIAPGLMQTPLTDCIPDQVRDFLAETVTNPSRLGLPEEYAKLVLHVIENQYINGSILRLDGAWRPFL